MRQPGSSGAGKGFKAMPFIKGALAVLIAVGVVGVIAVPSLQGFVLSRGGEIINEIRRVIAPEQYRVYATTATASTETADHPGNLLIDRISVTDWRSPEATPSIKLAFDAPFDLAALYVHNGTAENYVGFRRPTALAFVFPDGSRAEISLIDDHKPQYFEISANDIKEVEIRVVAATGPADAPIALSEVEFIGKR